MGDKINLAGDVSLIKALGAYQKSHGLQNHVRMGIHVGFPICKGLLKKMWEVRSKDSFTCMKQP